MSKLVFRLVHPEARRRAAQACQDAADGWIVTIAEPTRTLDQNARLWAMLNDIAKQVDWYGKQLSAEDWKAVFTAALKKQDVVPGLDGGFVVLSTSTSRMSKRELSDLLELMMAFGIEHEVNFGAEA